MQDKEDKMKIGFTGTMSVGKTTLVNALKEVPEFKDYKFATERSAYLSSLGIPLNHETTIEGQTIFLAERVSELMQPKIITDRTILDVIAFTKCANKVSVIDSDSFEKYASRFIKQYDHIFYISPKGIDIEDNGVRETDSNYRKEIDETIQKFLLKYYPKAYDANDTYCPYKLKGTTEERIAQIMEVVYP
jgi:GTPase SAR1 family protein